MSNLMKKTILCIVVMSMTTVFNAMAMLPCVSYVEDDSSCSYSAILPEDGVRTATYCRERRYIGLSGLV